MKLINLDNIEAKEINSYNHKIRIFVFNELGEIFLIDMNGSYNLPGGTVENNENLNDALTRELEEELGVRIAFEDIEFLGNYHFYHKNFPNNKSLCNRENEVDLFLVKIPIIYAKENTHITNYEKSQNFKVIFTKLENIQNLINERNKNVYKKFTDVELLYFTKVLKKYLEGEVYVR